MTTELTDVITVRVTKKIRQALIAIADRRGLREADIARMKLAELVQENEQPRTMVDSPESYKVQEPANA